MEEHLIEKTSWTRLIFVRLGAKAYLHGFKATGLEKAEEEIGVTGPINFGILADAMRHATVGRAFDYDHYSN